MLSQSIAKSTSARRRAGETEDGLGVVLALDEFLVVTDVEQAALPRVEDTRRVPSERLPVQEADVATTTG